MRLHFGASPVRNRIVQISESQPLFTTTKPKRFSFAAVLGLNAFGLLLGLPIVASIAWVSFRPLGLQTYLFPLATTGLAIWLLPFGLGNWLARRLAPEAKPSGGGWLVQVTAKPRVRTGLRAMLEDADDIGWLQVEGGQVRFEGDSLRLCVGPENVRGLCVANIGFRGLFLYGSKVEIELAGAGGLQGVEIAERQSLLLPESRRRSRELQDAIRAALTRGH